MAEAIHAVDRAAWVRARGWLPLFASARRETPADLLRAVLEAAGADRS